MRKANVLFFTLAFSGCTLITSLGDREFADPDASNLRDAGDGDADGGAECPSATHRCVPGPGAPWLGPFAVTSDDTPCAGAFPDHAIDLFAGLTVSEARCDCVCGSPIVDCPTRIRVLENQGAASGCDSSLSLDTHFATASCSNLYDDWLSVEAEEPNAVCGMGTVVSTIDAPSWLSSLRACRGAASGGVCQSGGVCAPLPGDPFDRGRICVAAPGDLGCPAGYDERTIAYTSFADSRACPTACACEPVGQRCEVTVRRYGAGDCADAALAPVTVRTGGDAACLGDQTIVSVRPDSPSLTPGRCEPATVALTGIVMETGMHTVCCTP